MLSKPTLRPEKKTAPNTKMFPQTTNDQATPCHACANAHMERRERRVTVAIVAWETAEKKKG